MSDTPIYDQLKAEEFDQTLARVNTTVQQAGEALQQFGQDIRAAATTFDEVNNVAGQALKAGRTRPADQYTLTRKPLLKKGNRR